MKRTFLAYRDPNAETKELIEISKEQWKAILETNKKTPYERRRFFIRVCYLGRTKAPVQKKEV